MRHPLRLVHAPCIRCLSSQALAEPYLWYELPLALLLLRPLRCRHCYARFLAFGWRPG